MSQATLRFGRRFFVPDLFLALVELLVIVGPLAAYFSFSPVQSVTLLATVPASLGVASLIWFVAVRNWRSPIGQATRKRLANETLDADELDDAYRAIVRFPLRASILRVGLWTALGAVVGWSLHLRSDFSELGVLTCVVVACAHSFAVNVFRAVWYTQLLGVVRRTLLPDLDPLRRFSDGYVQSLLWGSFCTGAIGIAVVALITAYFVPMNLEQYLKLETYFPFTVAALMAVWAVWTVRRLRAVDEYLAAAQSPRSEDQPRRDDPRAVAAYRLAQRVPYDLALTKVAGWLIGEALLAIQGVWLFGLDVENAVLLCGETTVVALGVALYEALWHRATMRPLLRHLAARHRPSPDLVRTPLSLRSKMLVAFGALIVFACGLSLFWSFTQYKTLATGFIQRESELRLESILTELSDHAQHSTHRLTQAEVAAALESNLRRNAPHGKTRDETVLYYLPADGSTALAIGAGTGKWAPPVLPWTGEALMRRLDRGQMELSAQHLTGAYRRLVVVAEGDRAATDLGSFAVMLPGYRGRGPSVAPQIRILAGFFVILLLASMGIVVLVVADLTRPIRELERRAAAMAKGDLGRPVVSLSGEGDEVGRLTFAFEEMRRALNDKLRSSTEINLSLEQEVGRRTAELERRNQELAEALEQLRRAQDELVRSEKMASMGRLVAGIAHEINNPVNAVVNTVGPLAQTLDELGHKATTPADIEDLQEMIRVIQRGAKRTKEIVQALHNYSRGDDERLVEVDLHRGLDESLDLLRHHLKNGIRIERNYGPVGRVRGRTALNQVFMNLLTNAAQAIGDTGGNGTIGITTRQEGDRIVVQISDDGPGIAAEALPRIFDPFFTTKDVGQGSGLGLSIVHGIVERHGGTISVDSAPGRGTTFTVVLPRSGEIKGAVEPALETKQSERPVVG